MDSENKMEILETCERFVTFCINTIIQLKCPEIDDDFPDYPTGFPQEWLFQPPKKLEEASSSKTKKSRKGKELAPKKKKLDVDELNNSVSKRKSQRKRKFSGTYNVEKNLQKLFEEQSDLEDPVDIKHPVNDIKCLHSENDSKDVLNESPNISDVQKLSPKSAEVEISNENEQNLQNFQTFIIKKHEKKKPRIRTLSETSSDEDEEEEVREELDLSVKFPMCLLERCDSQVNLTKKSLDSPKKPHTSNAINNQVNLSPKALNSPKKPQTSNAIDNQVNLSPKALNSPKKPQTSNSIDKQVNLSQKSLDSPEKPHTSNGITKHYQLPKLVFQKPQKVQDCKALKSIFQESTSFDDAMQKYAEKKKELQKIVPPKIIPAPEHDPSVRKVVKKKPIKDKGTMSDESNPNQHLGGIFTINNGWDKQESKKIEVENEKQVVNKLERKVTPPNIVIDTNIEDVLAAHDEFMYNGDFMNNLLISQDSKTSFSTASSHSLQIALSGDKLPESNSFNVRKINSSLNSSDEDSENEDIVKPPPKKVQKILYSDDEDENEVDMAPTEEEEENHNKNDNDVVSLFAEAGEFDDLEEEQFYAEVDPDDLKLKVQCIKRKIDPLDHQTEFDMNTKEISQHMADPETDKILKTFFANVCPAFLESRCSMPDCQRNHFVPEESRVHPLLINATFDVLHKVYQVILKYHRLFQAYISILVEICVKNKDETGLVELVKACDRIPRTTVCYKDIVRKLVELDFMKEHKAISLIIAHHTDTEIARDTILSLILDSGPCITLFMDYVEKAHIKQPIRSDMFSRILHTCVAYQNPKLPNFCLNYLQGLSANQMKNLNSEHLKAFLQMNKCISELNENREAKALRITQKLLSAMDW